MAMAMLKLYAERHYGRERHQFFAMRPATYEYRDLISFYSAPERLATWLTKSGAIGEAGQRYALELRNGVRASGEVLAVTGWEVQLSWDEIEGALGLKGFGIGKGRRAISIHGSGWGLSAERAAALEAFFADALGRLATVLDGVANRQLSRPTFPNSQLARLANTSRMRSGSHSARSALTGSILVARRAGT